VNPRPFVADQALPFNPETLTTYEAGFKADLLDRRWRLNGAVFFNKYNDIQGTKLSCPESVLVFPCLRPANVGQGEMKGFELETSIYPTDGLSIDGSVAYIDFEYTGPFNAAGTFLENTGIPAGATTPYTPKWTWSLGGQYDYEFESGAVLGFRLDGSYQSDIFTTSENSPFSRIDSYFLANGRISFTTADEEWQVYGEVKNIFDKYYFLSVSDPSLSLGVVTGMPGLPRTFTVGVKKNFGPSDRDEPQEYIAPAAPEATFKQCLDGSVVAMDAACPPPPAPAVPPAPEAPRPGERG
jgi:iron complex outermembrane receptor protein